MKYCPKCETKYDDLIRFCTKDGSPLIAEEEPKFIQMPSEDIHEDADDPSEMTVIRRNVTPPPVTPPVSQPPSGQVPPSQPVPPSALDEITFDANDNPPPRIVVPMDEEPPVIIPPRPKRPEQAYYAPQKTNTAVVVLLTIIGTTIVLGGVGILFWLLQRDHSSNTNNSDLNVNLQNVNLGISNNLNIDSGGYNFNFNTNTNSSTNVNANANANANKSPSPTRTPTPTPSPTENPENSNVIIIPGNSNRPTNSTPSPRPSLSPDNNRPINGGVLNGRAVSLPTPSYPPLARQTHVTGQVMVEVSVDETGRVTAAKAVSGNPLLRASAENAARQSRIIPSRINNENVRTTGLLVYNFREN